MSKKSKKGEWVVDMVCTITRTVYCSGCTEEEATNDPFKYSTHEVEGSIRNWEVQKVEAQ